MDRTAREVDREAVAARLRVECDLGYWDGKSADNAHVLQRSASVSSGRPASDHPAQSRDSKSYSDANAPSLFLYERPARANRPGPEPAQAERACQPPGLYGVILAGPRTGCKWAHRQCPLCNIRTLSWAPNLSCSGVRVNYRLDCSVACAALRP